jgi:hypothetical protein
MLGSPELLILWQKHFMMKMYDENMEIHTLLCERDLMNVMLETIQSSMTLNSKNQFD